MDAITHVDHLEAEGRRFATLAASCAGDEPVEACPGWDVDQLLRHLATVHEWARRATVGGGDKPPPRRPMEADAPGGHAELVTWYADLHRGLVEALRTTDPAAQCWQMWSGPDGPAYWARRQAHETAVHRLDLEIVTGNRTPVDAALAADGVDELLVMNEPIRDEAPAGVYRLTATDTGDAWTATTGAASPDSTEGVQVSGTAADLYAFCWNRRPETTPVVSDPSGWDEWRRHVTV